MQYRRVPKNGDELSILGFGCMRLPVKDGKIDEARAISQIRYAIDQGVNYVDTAWPYHGGESEVLLGKALRDGYRDKVKLATKLPSWMIKSRADMDRFLAAQLQKLATDHIDYYLVHSLDGPSWNRLAQLDVRDFLDQAKADGRITNAGFSFHGLAAEFKPIVDAYPWIFCQIQYNYLDENYQAGTEGLEYAAANDLAMIVMEPLRGGKLASVVPPAIDSLWKKAKIQRAPVEWALRWIWNRPEVTSILSGMNEEAHIRQNLAIASDARTNALSNEELDLIHRVGRKYRELMKVDCTGCGYCMPCNSDVMIPSCFDEYNNLHMFGARDEVRFIYAMRMSGILGNGRPGYASQCAQCGDCLEKCPQRIQIPALLAQIADELEGPDLAERVAIAQKMFSVEAGS